jgi:hypothetical protein
VALTYNGPQHGKLAGEVTRYCHIPKHFEDEKGKEKRVATLDVSSPLWDGFSRLALRESLLALLSKHIRDKQVWEVRPGVVEVQV